MVMKRNLLRLLGLLLLSAPALGQAAVLTVNSAGGATYTTITDALNASAPGDEIRITGGGPYAESLNIDARNLTAAPAGAVINGTVNLWGYSAVTIEGIVINPGGGRGIRLKG